MFWIFGDDLNVFQVVPSCALGKFRFDTAKPFGDIDENSSFAPVRSSSAILREFKDHSGIRR